MNPRQKKRTAGAVPKQVALPWTPDAFLEPPPCSWRATEEIHESYGISGTQCLCLSPRIKVHPHDEFRQPIKASIIALNFCSTCIYRNEQLTQPDYDSLTLNRWGKTPQKARLRVRLRRFVVAIRRALVEWWRTRRNPIVSRTIYRLRVLSCAGCEVCQPPEKPTYCSECSCTVALAANLMSKHCPRFYWPGDPKEAMGAERRERPLSKVAELRAEYAKSTVRKPADKGGNRSGQESQAATPLDPPPTGDD